MSQTDHAIHNLLAQIAGHYHFGGIVYQKLVEKLNKKIDIRGMIINEITKVIEHYSLALR
jgi:hypothetical protein